MKKTKQQTPRKFISADLSGVLGLITPLEQLQTGTKMALAARLDDLIKAKGWGKKEFAEKLHKNPSEITKWLSGTHNFTIDTLSEIAYVLDIPVAELFASGEEQLLNRLHTVVTARKVNQGVTYITPLTATPGTLKHYRGSIHHSSRPTAGTNESFRQGSSGRAFSSSANIPE